MLDFILAFFDKGLFKKRDVWVMGYVEDNRTLLIGNSYSEKRALEEAHSDRERIVQYSKDGLLKVFYPPNITDPREVPEDVMQTITEHLGIASIEELA